MTEKKALHNHCLQIVQQRLENIQAEIKNIQNAANEETKSSAGDKYETGRAMAQLEIERLLSQRQEVLKLYAALQSLKPEIVTDRVQPGSLVTTNKGFFYIAISLGAVTFNGNHYFVVSPDSPIAKLQLGKKVGDSINWNNAQQIIQLLG